MVVGGFVSRLRNCDGERNTHAGHGRPQERHLLQLQSADVIHSFWVPQLSGKTDLIPNRTNLMWIDPREPGIYLGNCAEYCGTQHANMLLRVVAEDPEKPSKRGPLNNSATRWTTRMRPKARLFLNRWPA